MHDKHECVLEVRTPRVKLPDGSVRLVKREFAGKLSGFTLLFEVFVWMLALSALRHACAGSGRLQ